MNQQKMCPNCMKILNDVNMSLDNLAGSLVVAEIICKCKCGRIHSTGGLVMNKSVVVQEPSNIVIPRPEIVGKKKH